MAIHKRTHRRLHLPFPVNRRRRFRYFPNVHREPSRYCRLLKGFMIGPFNAKIFPSTAASSSVRTYHLQKQPDSVCYRGNLLAVYDHKHPAVRNTKRRCSKKQRCQAPQIWCLTPCKISLLIYSLKRLISCCNPSAILAR